MHANLAPVRQEADAIRTRPVILALLGAMVLAGASVLWGWIQLRADVADFQPQGLAHVRPVPVGPPAVGGVLQTLIGVDSSAAMLVANRRARLESWGWVDRERGIVHIPIEAAMNVLIEEAAQ